MPETRTAQKVLSESFLDVRAKLIEIAAALDRIDRAGLLASDSAARRDQIRQAIEILLGDDNDRAARLQHLFSRDYDGDWRQQMNL
ncbi:MAG: hypothetical protein AAGA03_16640 [Planctomycetota bacterium]